MKNVIFKMKFNHPNKYNSPKLNENHFSYICKRPRAMFNEGKDFCCFGKVSEMGHNHFGDIDKFSEMKNHIQKKSKEKTTFYKCVVSLTEEDTIEKGFTKREKWEELIKNKSSKIAKEMGIKVENFEYVCSVHMEKGHPHIHFMAWDKEQEIQKTVVPKNKINNIRRDLTNYVFKEELDIFYTNKNNLKKTYDEDLKEYFSEFEKMFDMSNKEYNQYLLELKSMDLSLNRSKLCNINIKEKYVSEIMKDIHLLKKELPKTGRLNYGFMPEQIKNHLDTISKKILASNIELRSGFSNYIESVKKIQEFSTSSTTYTDRSVKVAEDEILKYTGNQILNICKRFLEKENNIKKEEFELKQKEIAESIKNFERQEMISLVSNIFNFLAKQENKNKNIEKNKAKGIFAKKDLAKKLESKSQIDWER